MSAQAKIARKMAARVMRIIPLPFRMRWTFYRAGGGLGLAVDFFSHGDDVTRLRVAGCVLDWRARLRGIALCESR